MVVELDFHPPLPPPPAPMAPTTLKFASEGQLHIGFRTGQHQHVDMSGTTLVPMLAASPSSHDFGVVHTEEKAELTLFITNPTEVDAEWELTHVVREPLRPGRLLSGVDGGAFYDDAKDDPTVFAWGEHAGTQCGPSLPLDSTAACLPRDVNRERQAIFGQSVTALEWTDGRGHGGEDHLTKVEGVLRQRADENERMPRPVRVVFSPKRNVRYCCRFRFEVAHGQGFDVVLSGCGTYEEHVPVQKPARI